jgi:hypothetical protein
MLEFKTGAVQRVAAMDSKNFGRSALNFLSPVMPGGLPTLIWLNWYHFLGLETMRIAVTASLEGTVLADRKSPSNNTLAALAKSITN